MGKKCDMKRVLRKLESLAGITSVLYSCASIGRPDGGIYDDTPPRFLGSTPALGELNYNKKKISLEFDEYVKLEKANEKVTISPPQVQQPDIRAVGKRRQVNLEDTLKANTT